MMIEVNLLPVELRRVEHTPLPRFLVIIAGTALVMATVAFGVVVNMRTVPDLKAKEQLIARDIATSQPAAAAYDTLQDEISDTNARRQTIAELWRTRIQWSRKLAQLAQMTPEFVGFTDVKLDEPHAGGTKDQENGGMLTLESILSGADLDRVANWRRIVEGEIRLTNNLTDGDVGKDFYRSFLDLLPTESTKIDVKEDYVEKEALKVALKMPIKPPSARLGEALEATQAELKAKAAATIPASAPVKRTRPAKPQTPEAPEKPAAPSSEAPAPENKENASTELPSGVTLTKTQVTDASGETH